MIITQTQAIRQAWERHDDNLLRPPGLYGLDTGHHDLNLALQGWVPSTITTLAARSRHGKTAATLQMIEASSNIINGKRGDVLFFTWELSAKTQIERFVSHSAGITMGQYRYAKALPKETQEDILRSYSRAKNFPVNYHQTSTDVDTVIKVCEENLKRIKGEEIALGIKIQPVVIIDYVSLAKSRQKSYGSKTYDIGDFMSTFKQYVNASGYAGVFLAQVRRDAEGEPHLHHVQDSGAYEQNSDNLIILYRPEADMVREIRDPVTDQMIDSKDRFMWRILKCREGDPHDILGYCDIKYFRFWHRHHKYGFDYNSLYGSEEFWAQQYGV